MLEPGPVAWQGGVRRRQRCSAFRTDFCLIIGNKDMAARALSFPQSTFHLISPSAAVAQRAAVAHRKPPFASTRRRVKRMLVALHPP